MPFFMFFLSFLVTGKLTEIVIKLRMLRSKSISGKSKHLSLIKSSISLAANDVVIAKEFSFNCRVFIFISHDRGVIHIIHQ